MRAIQPGDRIGDRFVVESLLGEGGIARVYKVHHARLGSIHAVKLLMLPKDTLRDRLLLEGRIQAQLRHPNLVTVNDIIEHDGRMGLVMEYVEGTNLQDHLFGTGALPVHEALSLFTPVLSAVATAHDLGALHRDLKPANILLERTAAGLVPKVSDFGIAQVKNRGMRQGKTGAGELMGTPGYMSPEQVDDSGTVDLRADIFALGAILYEMLCGVRAFQGDSAYQVLRATVEGTYTPIIDILPLCPGPIRDAIEKALSEDPDDRHTDCHTFADALLMGRPALRSQVRRDDARGLPDGFRSPIGSLSERPPTTTAVPELPPHTGLIPLPVSVGGPAPTRIPAGDAVDPARPGSPAMGGAAFAGPSMRGLSVGGPSASGSSIAGPSIGAEADLASGGSALARSPRSISPSAGAATGAGVVPLMRSLGEEEPSLGAPFIPGPASGASPTLSDEADSERPDSSRLRVVGLGLALVVGLSAMVWVVTGWLGGDADTDGREVVAATTEAVGGPRQAEPTARPTGRSGAAQDKRSAGGPPAPPAVAETTSSGKPVAPVGSALVTTPVTAPMASAATPSPVPEPSPTASPAPAGPATTNPDVAEASAPPTGTQASDLPTPSPAPAVSPSSPESVPPSASSASQAPADPPATEATIAAVVEGSPTEARAAVTPSAGESPDTEDESGEVGPFGAVEVSSGAEPKPPQMVGTWMGTANGRPLTVSLTAQDGNRVVGTVTVEVGPQQRIARVSGTVDAVARRLVLAEVGGMEMRFVGVLAGSGVMGQFTAKGQGAPLAWSATRQ